jgi:uncharacterized protein YndB with AHSA1/START domain
MPKTTITTDQDTVVSEIEIAAPPARVFEALVNRDQALKWGNSDEFEIVDWEMDARPGGKWRFLSRERRGGKTPAGQDEFDHNGEVVEVDPPRVLAYTWFANWHEQPEHRTVVRWELTPTTKGTLVRVTHSGLAQLPAARTGYSQGWPGLLDALRKFFEK